MKPFCISATSAIFALREAQVRGVGASLYQSPRGVIRHGAGAPQPGALFAADDLHSVCPFHVQAASSRLALTSLQDLAAEDHEEVCDSREWNNGRRRQLAGLWNSGQARQLAGQGIIGIRVRVCGDERCFLVQVPGGTWRVDPTDKGLKITKL